MPPTPSPPTWRRLARGGRRYALPWLSTRRWLVRVQFVGAALLAGLICIAFALGADHAIALHRGWVNSHPWLSLLITPAGFAAMVWLAHRFVPGALGSGIPQTLAAMGNDDGRLRQQLLSLRIALAKVVLTLGGLLSGASVGREGPSVQIGASVMCLLAGRKSRHVAATNHDLMAAGGGAGVAAAFNTPLGGIMFAIEELCRYRAFRANSTTLLAVIFAGLMSLAVLGNYTYFGRTPAAIAWPAGLGTVLACGVLGGLLGGGFARVLIASSRVLPGRLDRLRNEQPVRFAALCGLATALLGLLTGGLTYGTGYEESRAALEGLAPLPWYFVFAKLLAVWLVFVSRIPGGIFAPSLAIGAGLGAVVAGLLPGDEGAAVLVLGMVGFLSAMTQTPITSFVIVMEMTANHQMLLPLMATSVIAHAVSRTVAPTPLYQALAHPLLKRMREESTSTPHAPHPTESPAGTRAHS